MKYNFMITEYLRRSVRVEADDAEEAYQKVEDLLSKDKIDLTVDDFSDRDIQTIDDFENSEGRTCDETYPIDDDFSEPTKTFEQREYKGITFPIRECEWTKNGVTRRRFVGSTIMSDILWDGKNKLTDEDAFEIDCGIAYYVPHDLIINGSDDEIFDYIFREIEQEIMEIFEEEEK